MTFSVPLLIGIFLLCCTGAADRACSRAEVESGPVAALCLASLLLSGLQFQPWRILSVYPAALLPVLAAVIHVWRFSVSGLLVTLTAGALGWLLTALFPVFMEPSLFPAASSALLATLFLKNKGERLLPVLLTPLVTGGLTALSDWYLFDDGTLALGSSAQLDAQACGILLLGLLLSVPAKKIKAKDRIQQNEA